MYYRNDVLSGIITYNPDIERVTQCIKSVVHQTGRIIVYDNGSENIGEIEKIKLISAYDIELVKMGENTGVAAALAYIMKYARDNGYKWVLSLDQDSLLTEYTVDRYLKIENEGQCKEAALFTCLIKDWNYEDKKYEEQDEDAIEVEYCITSGSFMNVDKYFKTDGYDVDFFIDCVDFDICYNLRKHGFKIYRINHVGLFHEVGKGENRRFLWKKIVVYHEKPNRIFYLARNTKRLYEKYDEYTIMKLVKKEIAICLRILLYEGEKREKFKCYLDGIFSCKVD